MAYALAGVLKKGVVCDVHVNPVAVLLVVARVGIIVRLRKPSVDEDRAAFRPV